MSTNSLVSGSGGFSETTTRPLRRPTYALRGVFCVGVFSVQRKVAGVVHLFAAVCGRFWLRCFCEMLISSAVVLS